MYRDALCLDLPGLCFVLFSVKRSLGDGIFPLVVRVASRSCFVSGLKFRPLNRELRMDPDSVNGPSK